MIIDKFDNISNPAIIEFDPYVPLNIKWGTWNEIEEGSIYYRYGDLKHSLLEISIGSATRKLRSVTLVCIKEINVNSETYNVDIPVEDFKIPIFSTNDADSNIHVDASDFLRLDLYSNAISMSINSDEAIKTLKTGRVYVGINKANEMVSVTIADVSINEIEAFKKAL